MNSAISTGLFVTPGGQIGGQSTGLGCLEILCTCLGCQNGLYSRRDTACVYVFVSDALKTKFAVMGFVAAQGAGILVGDLKEEEILLLNLQWGNCMYYLYYVDIGFHGI